MAHNYTPMDYAEGLRIDSTPFVPQTGTITLSSCIVTLKDSAGVVVAACNGVPATGYTTLPSTAPIAWHQISPAALSLPVPVTQTIYVLSFLVTESGGQKYQSDIAIVIKP